GMKAELLLVGDGARNYVERLHGIVAANKLEQQVIFLGHLEHPASIVATADAVLTCSRSEAFGRATVEGMLSGKPVIGAKAGATPELIQDGFNGLLYTSGDHYDLATKIRCLYENPSVAVQLGHNGRIWAETTFTGERFGRELLSVLRPYVGAAS